MRVAVYGHVKGQQKSKWRQHTLSATQTSGFTFSNVPKQLQNMMKSKETTRVILLNVLKCCFAFYAIYYSISSICFAGFRLKNFDGKIPFDFKTWLTLPECCSQFSSEETVNFISMELSFAVSGFAFGLLLVERVWDYSLTVTLLHAGLSCLVMLNFPLNWSWWVCIGFAAMLMILLGELTSWIRRVRFKGRVSPEPDEGKNQTNFLYRKA